MSYNEILKTIKKYKQSKVRFTGNIIAIVNEEYNADTEKGVLQMDASKITKEELMKLQQFCLGHDNYTVTGSIIF